MRGTLRERSPGVWRLQVYLGRDPITGRERRASRTFHGGRRNAERALAAFVTETAQRSAATPGTVAELLDRWLEHGRHGWSPSTLTGHRSKVRLYLQPGLGALRLDRLTTARIDTFYMGLLNRGLSSTTVRHVHAALRRACEQGKRWGMLERNPAEDASPPKMRRTSMRPPSLDDLGRLVEGADPDLVVVVLLAAITGARRGELCALRWSDVDLDRGLVRITRTVVETAEGLVERDAAKTESSRRPVVLDSETVARLRAYRAAQGERALACGVRLAGRAFVLSDDPGGSVPLAPMLVTSRFRRLAARVGVECRFHDLRHFTGTQLADAGIPVANISRRLGHARTSTTQDIYAHALDDTDVRAAETIAARVYGEKISRKHG